MNLLESHDQVNGKMHGKKNSLLQKKSSIP